MVCMYMKHIKSLDTLCSFQMSLIGRFSSCEEFAEIRLGLM